MNKITVWIIPFDVNDMYEVYNSVDTCSMVLLYSQLYQYYSILETSGFVLEFPNYFNTSKSV